MQGWQIAILGATGAVGEALITLLQEREFPISKLFLLASEENEDESQRVNGKYHFVQNVQDFDWSQVQFAFFVAGREASRCYAELAAEMGCVVIDSSGYFALEPDVPLIVPTVNPQVLADFRCRNIVAVASGQVVQLLTSIQPLFENNTIQRLHVTQFVPASYFGKGTVRELGSQSARLMNGLPVSDDEDKTQLAFNLLPLLSSDTDAPYHEDTLNSEQIIKITQQPYHSLVTDSVQVPTFYGNGQLVHLTFAAPMHLDQVEQQFGHATFIEQSKHSQHRTLGDYLEEKPIIYISDIAHDQDNAYTLRFWSITDSVRFSGALAAVVTAELLVKHYYSS